MRSSHSFRGFNTYIRVQHWRRLLTWDGEGGSVYTVGQKNPTRSKIGIKSWTFWHIDRLSTSSYTGVTYFQNWSVFLAHPAYWMSETSYVKALESYHITDRHTDRQTHICHRKYIPYFVDGQYSTSTTSKVQTNKQFINQNQSVNQKKNIKALKHEETAVCWCHQTSHTELPVAAAVAAASAHLLQLHQTWCQSASASRDA